MKDGSKPVARPVLAILNSAKLKTTTRKKIYMSHFRVQKERKREREREKKGVAYEYLSLRT